MLSLYLCSLGKYAFAIFQAKLESIYRATFGRQQAKRFEVFAFPNSKLVLLSIHNLKWIKDFKVEHILVSRDTKSAFYWFQSFSLVQCIAGFLYTIVTVNILVTDRILCYESSIYIAIYSKILFISISKVSQNKYYTFWRLFENVETYFINHIA